jgi:hypothetical protein
MKSVGHWRPWCEKRSKYDIQNLSRIIHEEVGTNLLREGSPMNFASQSEVWLTNLTTRMRRPAKPSTLATFRAYVHKRIVPGIGEIELTEFSNAGMRKLVEYLAAQDLSAGTTNEIVSVVKQIVASAVDQNGDELFLRK